MYALVLFRCFGLHIFLANARVVVESSDGFARFPTFSLDQSTQGIWPSDGRGDTGTVSAPLSLSTTDSQSASQSTSSSILSSTGPLISTTERHTSLSTIRSSSLYQSSLSESEQTSSNSIQSSDSAPSVTSSVSLATTSSATHSTASTHFTTSLQGFSSQGPTPKPSPAASLPDSSTESPPPTSVIEWTSTIIESDSTRITVITGAPTGAIEWTSTIIESDTTRITVITEAPAPEMTTAAPLPVSMVKEDWAAVMYPVDVEIDGITYMLPRSTKFVKRIDKDHNAQVIELSPNAIKIGDATYDIPDTFFECSKEARAVARADCSEISLTPKNGAGPTIKVRGGQKSNKGTSGGLFGFLKGLGQSAKGALDGVSKAVTAGNSFIDSGFSTTSDFLSTGLDDLSSLLDSASEFACDARQMAADAAIELSELDEFGNMVEVAGQGIEALEEATDIVNQIQPLRDIIRAWNNLDTRGLELARDIVVDFFRFPSVRQTKSLILAAGTTGFIKLAMHDFSSEQLSSGGGDPISATTSQRNETVERTLYCIGTRYGTSSASYKAFTAILPDTMVSEELFPEIEKQILLIKLTEEEAKYLSKHPIVNGMSGQADVDPFDRSGLIRSRPATRIADERRDPTDPNDVGDLNTRYVRRSDAPDHLKLLSQSARGISDIPGYLFDQKLGKGSTVYIFDQGCDMDHTDLAQGEREEKPYSYAVPNKYTLDPYRSIEEYANHVQAPEDINDYSDPIKGVGYRSHGTPVASAAVGLTRGVAPKANLVCVKISGNVLNTFTNDADYPDGEHIEFATPTPWSIENALSWAVRDVVSKGRQGRAVFTMSYLFHADANFHGVKSPQHWVDHSLKVFENGIKVMNEYGILFTVGAGNFGTYDPPIDWRRFTHNFLPNRLEREDNAYLIVGGVDSKGRIDNKWSVAKPTNPAQIRIYAQGRNVDLARSVVRWDGSKESSDWETAAGTSFSTPQIAGLAAYLMSLDKVRTSQPGKKFSAVGIKKYLLKWGHELYPSESDKHDPNTGPVFFSEDYYDHDILVGYNRAADSICNLQSKKPKQPSFLDGREVHEFSEFFTDIGNTTTIELSIQK